jgi:cell division protein YceG involved in septum cleavage
MEKKKRVKIILWLFYFSSLICIIVLWFLFFKDNFSTLSQKVESANKLSKKEFNSETCKGIFELKDKEKILKHKDFNFWDYSNLKYRCNSLIV